MAALRTAEIEALVTVNTDDVDRADKKIKATGERIEKNPLKVDADAKGAIAGMDRVEAQAKKLVSERAVLKLDADIERTEKSFQRAQDRLEDLQVRAEGGLDVAADVKRAEANLQKLERSLAGLRSARAVVEVEGDVAPVLDALDQVEKAQKRVVSQETAVRINAEVSAATKAVAGFESDLEYLRALSPNVKVEADIAAAERKLDTARAVLRDLDGARAEMVVEVEDGRAKQKLKDVADYAEQAGEEGGEGAGGNLAAGIITALATIPIAGAVIGVGKAAGEALMGAIEDGLAIDQRGDRLEALTGLTPQQAARIGRGAGEAYASVFGESVEANMSTARVGVQFGIIDGDATTRDAQRVVEGLSGIADVMGEEVEPVARTVTTLLRNGFAGSAQEAFDLLAAGTRNGVDRSKDLLDTFTEYPVVLRKLGLDGQQSLGLLNQGLTAGARNSDVVADALKEFQIRATDSSEASAKGYERIGLNAEEMTAKIAAGGDGAREGLQQVLDGLRAMEDPVQRNAAAVELFGTKAEDMGDALFALDLNTAVEQLDGVTGSAQRMFDTLADNDATKLEGAKRNIETAMAGIQGALASALSDPIEDAAEFVQKNRGPVLQFFIDLANGALDFAETASDGFGAFISGPLAETVEGLAGLIDVFNGNEGRPKELDDLADGMRNFDAATGAASDKIAQARDRLNEFAEPQLALAYLSDSSLRLAESIDQVGTSATDGRSMLEDYSEAQDGSARISGELRDQVWQAVEAMNAEQQAASDAGESQDDLNTRWSEGRDALVQQLEQMGIVPEKAQAIVDAYDRIPPTKTTTVTADTSPAEQSIAWLTNPNRFRINLPVFAQPQGPLPGPWKVEGRGDVLEFMAKGGIPGLTPMAPLAQMVPASTWRVVGDRSDVPEAYIPLDGSARSMGLLAETIRRMPGVMPMDAGGIVSTGPMSAGKGETVKAINQTNHFAHLPPEEAAELARQQLADMANGSP